jgi:hypothetical protein
MSQQTKMAGVVFGGSDLPVSGGGTRILELMCLRCGRDSHSDLRSGSMKEGLDSQHPQVGQGLACLGRSPGGYR